MHELVIASKVPERIGNLDLFEAFLEGRTATTLKAYKGDLLDFARRMYSTRDIGEALNRFTGQSGGDSNLEVLKYRNQLAAAGLASATIARRLAALRSFTKLARMLGRITWTIEVQAPKPEPRRDVRGPTKEERKKVFKLLNTLGNGKMARRDRAIVGLLFGLALRRAEVVSLDLDDIDPLNATVAILGKGRREKVLMPLSTDVSKSIESWIFARGQHPGPLFTRLDRPGSTQRLSGEAVLDMTAKLGAKAGLSRKLRPHGFRHAAITSALSAGLSPKEVRDLTRHAKFETLLGYDDLIHSGASKVAKALGKEWSAK